MLYQRDNPAAPVWDLVSGYAGDRRTKRGLMVLQACIDDSGHADGPYYVLGGLMAPAERWAEFSIAWNKELKADIPLEYFHAVEANGRRDQFDIAKGWSRDLRDAKVSKLCGLVTEFAACRIHVSMDVSAFREIIVSRIGHWGTFNSQRPYWILFHKLVLGVIALQCRGDGTPQPIDFIFDEQGAIGDEAASAMRSILQNLKSQTLPNGVKPKDFIKSSPAFKDDKEFLPIQAADLYAWSVSRYFFEYHKTGFDVPPPTFAMLQKIPAWQFHYGKDEFERLALSVPAWIAE